MANLNNSSNNGGNLNPPCLFQFIVQFDKLKTEQAKLRKIKILRFHQSSFCREVSKILSKRMNENLTPIPDKSIFVSNLNFLDKQGLKNLCNDMRFLLATKFRTF